MTTGTNVAIAKGKELEISEPFLADYRTGFHARQAAALLKMSHSTAALALGKLERKNILRSEQEGRNKKYYLNLDNFLTKSYIMNAESMMAVKYFERRFIFKKMFSELADVIRETPVILFGSYAKESHSRGSDMDILILADNEKKEVAKALEKFGERNGKMMHVQKISRKGFEKGLMERDTLVLEVVKNHIILNNIPVIVDILWRHYNAIR